MVLTLPNNRPWTDWDFDLRIATNHVYGIGGISKYGENQDISNTREDIWSTGGTLSYLSSAETMNIVSTSTNDDGNPAGTGAQTVTIFGVDGNYKPIAETVTMNGQTNVLTTKSFLRVNRIRLDTCGAGGTNAGVISATASSAATVQAEIPAGYGSTLKTQYTVADGFYAYCLGLTVSTLNNDQVNVRLEVRNFNSGAWVTFDNLDFTSTTVIQNYQVPLVFSPKSDIRVTGIRISGTGTAVISARWKAYLVKEELVNPNRIIVGNP